MLKKIMYSFVFSLILLPLAILTNAKADTDTQEKAEAQQLADNGAKYLQTHNLNDARKAFSDSKGEFRRGNLYLFVNSFSNVILVHGANPSLEGLNFSNQKDKDGVYYMREMSKLAQNSGSGWVHYKFMNYEARTVMNKVSYIKRVPGKDYYVGCGYYTNN